MLILTQTPTSNQPSRSQTPDSSRQANEPANTRKKKPATRTINVSIAGFLISSASLCQDALSQPVGSVTQALTFTQPLASRFPVSVFLIATQKPRATSKTIRVYSTSP